MPLTQTGFVFDDRYLLHDTGAASQVQMSGGTFTLSPEPHPSSTAIIRRTQEFLDGSGLTAQMKHLDPRAASEDELALYHTRDYIAGLRELSQKGGVVGPLVMPWGEIDDETVLGPDSLDAALYAAGGALNAVSAVMDGQVHNAYALLRPPCHHATRNQALGFCIFNNTVLAAKYALSTYKLNRVMIVDWDVHHGNGTQDAFYTDADVLFVSLHQENWYPKLSGELEQVGSGAGAGYTVNIPLPPGTGDRGYLAAFEQLVVPIGRRYRPQLIIVTAGQDACWLDPRAHMMMTMQGYRQISELTVGLAEEVCEGRLVMLQAGGYSAAYMPYCTAAAVEPLLGVNSGFVDFSANFSELERCQTILLEETRRALVRAHEWHRQWWAI